MMFGKWNFELQKETVEKGVIVNSRISVQTVYTFR